MIKLHLRDLLEYSKDFNFENLFQSKISRKLSLCQKLQNFFEDSKSLTNLRSLEFLSTSLMISAKMFENEEEVKTFKKHAKICSRSIGHLKGIELDILSKLNWNLKHYCVFDFGLFYFSNYLFVNQDLIHVSRSADFEYQFMDLDSYIANKLGLNSLDMKKIKSMLDYSEKKNKIIKPIVRVKDIHKKDFINHIKIVFSNFESILKLIHLKFVFKSEIKVIIGIYILLYLKEYHSSAVYSTYYQFKQFMCSTVKRY